jgi:hypothetical protein
MATEKFHMIAAVQEGIETMRHERDISREDCEPDAKEWESVKAKLTELMWRAYQRNHDVT